MKHTIYIILGTFLYAISATQLLIPNHISEGGIVGLSLLFYFAIGLSPGISTFFIFIILLGFSLKFLPRDIVYKTIFNVPLLSFFIYLTEGFGKPISDPLLASIFAGLLTGIGFGLICQAGSSIGGTSIIARILNYRLGWDLISTNFIIDALIVLSGIFVIGIIYTMYTIISLYIGKVVTDYVLGGFNAKKAVNIISPKGKEISEKIMREMSSSTTIFNGHGGYTAEKREILYVVVPVQRLLYLKRLIREVDSHAFVVVNNVKDVSGGTFFVTPYARDSKDGFLEET